METFWAIFFTACLIFAIFLIIGKIYAPSYRKLLKDLRTQPVKDFHYPYAIIGSFKSWAFTVGETKVTLQDGTAHYSYGKAKFSVSQETRLLPMALWIILKLRKINRSMCEPYDDSTYESRMAYWDKYN